jgi:nucleoside-diphosphate-sugar epimerase
MKLEQCMRVLILGGTKFIGAAVVDRLITGGHEVAVFHRGETESGLPSGVTHIHGERKKLKEFQSQFEQFAPEIVIDMILFNEAEANELVAVCQSLSARVVVISSLDVYQAYDRLRGVVNEPLDNSPLGEDAPLRVKPFPYRVYARDESDRSYYYDKIPAERVVMNCAEVAGTILRLPFVYGAGDYQHRLAHYLQRMDDGRPAIILGATQANWRGTRGAVENVADAIVLATEQSRASGRVYNVGEAIARTEVEWVTTIAQIAGWQGKVAIVADELLPAHLQQPLQWQHHIIADTTRLRNELGYQERVTCQQALKNGIEWERQQRSTLTSEQVAERKAEYQAEDQLL